MSKPLVLVTRPQRDAERSAERLRELGFEPLVAPVMKIVATDAPLPQGPFDALVVTSANAIDCLENSPGFARLKGMEAFAVGARTAQVLREAGFDPVLSADGDRHDLAGLIAGHLSRPSRLLLAVGLGYPRDFVQKLAAAGHDPVVVTLYERRPAEELDGPAVAALNAGVIGCVLHYSPASARAFLACAKRSGVDQQAKGVRHVVLSPAVADPLRAAGIGTVDVARRPEEGALLETLAETMARKSGVAGGNAALYISSADTEDGSGEDAVTQDRNGEEPENKRPASSRRRHAPIIEATAVKIEEASSAAPDPAPSPSPEAAGGSSNDETGARPEGNDGPSATVAPSEPNAADTAKAGPSPEPARSSWFPVAASGVIGGALGAGLLASLPWITGADTQSEDRIAAVETRLSALAPRTAVDALGSRVSGLDPRVSATQTKLDDLTSRLGAIEQRLASIPAGGTEQTAKSNGLPAGDQQSFEAVEARLKRAEAGLSALGTRLDPVPARLDDLAGRIEAVEPKLLRAENETDKRLQGVEGKLAVLDRGTADRDSAVQAARLLRSQAIASALRRALEGGAPFKSELDALQGLGADPAALAGLAPFASAGAPTARALAESYAPLAPKVASAASVSESKPSFVDRLTANVTNLVKIRPIGETSGNDPGALSTRIAAALSRDDLGSALEAWKALPDPSRQAAEAWGKTLEARVRAQDAANSLVTQATQALARSGS